ncbi:hypothetical protein HYH02_005606 [Chlamydomonas schloesseri]|uniref:monoamine oxidase n=1 Tax=Chlamydomonas schloesseri TaxID=2026947 RepID=A0A835WKN3_9CHLO|nr:hypothetical protein HYH02_005606 [Chlamydomonas schloesseri]|eukprot:KAG2449459.1 hypothetical protein HYH02_005606 [Chlamydomonas schloesseri]
MSAHTTLLSSGASAPLTPAEEAELAAVCASLDAWGASVRDPAAWPTHPHAADWDRQNAADYFERCTSSDAVRRELFTLVRTVLASEPAHLSLLFLLHFLGQVGGLEAVADGDGGAQTLRIRGGAQQLSTGMAAQLTAASAAAGGRSGVGRSGDIGAVRGGGGGGSCELRLGFRVARVELLAGDDGAAAGGGLARGSASASTSASASSERASDGSGAGGGGGVRVHLEPSGEDDSGRSSKDNSGGGGSASNAGAARAVTARCVVVAMSPPLWGSLQWSPPLPPAKRAISQRMYMGRCVKTIAVFDTAFWSCTTGDAHHAVAVAAADAASGSADEPPLQPAGGEQRRPHLEDCGPVANLFPSVVDGRPALVGLVVAAAAAAFAALPPAEQRRVVLRQYARYFGVPDEQAVAGGCRAFLVKDWMAESYSRGCYAALMPPGLASSSPDEGCGVEGSGGGGSGRGVAWGCGPDAARAPVWGGRVHFAGTELAREWAGYFEGALESGYRAADEVLEALARGTARVSSDAAGAGLARSRL